jgi:nucleotide-binding universal stress UspA family protein
MATSWKPIVVGVDGSPESVRAAELGGRIAERAGVPCHLVHAAPDYWTALTVSELGLDAGELDRATEQHARATVSAALAGRVPQALLDGFEVRVGRAPVVLAEAAERHGAEVLVLGGKHHRGLDRITSSTVVHMVRARDVPVLATDGGSFELGRILACVDLSHAAMPTLRAAERWADLFGAHLRVLSVVEPMPVVPGVTLRVSDDEVFRASERLLELSVWPAIRRPGAETVVRRGRSAAAIVDEAARWHADLVVVGSHGRGWVNRLLIGSTSERLLHVLPATTLLVPVGEPRGEKLRVDTMPWEGETVARAGAET